MKIGIIGAGHIGSALALLLVKAGHKVTITSKKGPESLIEIAKKTGAQTSTIDEITHDQEIVIIAIPQKAILELPKTLFSSLHPDVTVIDTGNYVPTLRDGNIAELDNKTPDSEWVQTILGRPVVKAFNNISYKSLTTLGKPKGNPERIALTAAADRPTDKVLAFKLFDAVGFDSVDGGTIKQSWRQQPGSTIFCADITQEEMISRLEKLGTEWTDEHFAEILTVRQKQEDYMLSIDPINHYGSENHKRDLSFLK